MSTVLSIIIFLAFVLAPTQQAPAGCAVASSDLQASLATAGACLDIPAGVYTLSGQGALLSATADNLTIHGAGVGQTVIKVTDGLTLTQDLVVLRLLGKGQRVSDLTIDLGSGHSGPWGTFGISVYTPAERATIERVEVLGGYTTDGARGAGVATYQPWNVQGGAQYVTMRDLYIHDMPMSGAVVNSSYNTLASSRFLRTGRNDKAHGIYAQGGYNLYDGNYVQGAGGFSFHGWKKVPNLDASGDVWRGNTSIDPGMQHMIVSGMPGNDGKPLTRSATITGNVFRNTAQRQTTGVLVDVPSIITDNTFEDVVKNGAAVIQANGYTPSVIRGNVIRALNPPATNGTGINPGASLVEGNVIDTRGLNAAIGQAAPGAIIGPNLIYRST